jgi:hypothetical protein
MNPGHTQHYTNVMLDISHMRWFCFVLRLIVWHCTDRYVILFVTLLPMVWIELATCYVNTLPTRRFDIILKQNLTLQQQPFTQRREQKQIRIGSANQMLYCHFPGYAICNKLKNFLLIINIIYNYYNINIIRTIIVICTYVFYFLWFMLKNW